MNKKNIYETKSISELIVLFSLSSFTSIELTESKVLVLSL